MSVRSFLLLLPLLLEVQSQVLNGLDLPADPIPVKMNFYNSYSPHIYNIDRGSYPLSCDSGENEWFIIQSTSGGLVLDASEPNLIKLQYFTGFAQQLWKFERAGKPGVYYIISNHTGAALEALKNGNPLRTVFLKQRSGSLTQKWMTNRNGRIYNVGTDRMLDVSNGKFVPGTVLNVWGDNGDKAQEFELQQKNQ